MTPFLSTQLIVYQFFGQVQPPPGVERYDSIGAFITVIIRLITIVAGIWALFNLIFAGFKYITAANDVKAVETAWQSIYMSLIGLIIIVSAFAIAAIVGGLFFGDATFIINPRLVPATTP